jgi:hypothetical protein
MITSTFRTPLSSQSIVSSPCCSPQFTTSPGQTLLYGLAMGAGMAQRRKCVCIRVSSCERDRFEAREKRIKPTGQQQTFILVSCRVRQRQYPGSPPKQPSISSATCGGGQVQIGNACTVQHFRLSLEKNNHRWASGWTSKKFVDIFANLRANPLKLPQPSV